MVVSPASPEQSAPAGHGRPLRGANLLLVVLGLATWGGCTLLGFPQFLEIKDKAMEAQTKAHIRIIWVALERYAVEHGGYPLWLLGGHPSDPNTTPMATVFNPYCPPTCGDGDALLLWGFLREYPSNPFFVGSSGRQISIPPLTWEAAGKPTPSCIGSPTNEAVRERVGGRRVGGPDMTNMFEVTEGGYACGPGGEPLGPYLSRGWSGHPPPPPLPPADGSVDCTRQICRSPRAYQRVYMPGQFLYTPWFENGAGTPWGHWPALADGYHIAGYGSVGNPGLDVYDWTGDMGQGIRWCVGEGVEGPCPSGGPDGEPDGILVLLYSRLAGDSLPEPKSPGVPGE